MQVGVDFGVACWVGGSVGEILPVGRLKPGLGGVGSDIVAGDAGSLNIASCALADGQSCRGGCCKANDGGKGLSEVHDEG